MFKMGLDGFVLCSSPNISFLRYSPKKSNPPRIPTFSNTSIEESSPPIKI